MTGAAVAIETSKRRSSPRWLVISFAAVALVLIASSWFLPLWGSRLLAPQYPGGLEMVVYGNRVEGDLAEIDALNHYIGMRPFRLEDFPEVSLWPLGVIAALLAGVVAAVWPRRWWGRAARIFLWVFPLSILAVIQIRLYQYGHDLDPAAAFRLDGFTPKVIGSTEVGNFTAASMPRMGVWVLLLAAALMSYGPRLVRHFTGGPKLAVLVVTLGLVVGGVAAPANAQHEHEGHDHGNPTAPSFTPVDARTPLTTVPPRPDYHHLSDLASLVEATPEGGTLTLPAGAYRGGVVIERPITIEGVDFPVIIGDRTSTVLTITASDVVVKGIQVTGSGPGPSGAPAGIKVSGTNVTLEQVVVDDSYMGIALDGASRVRIYDSLIVGRSQHAVEEDGHATSSGGHEHHATGGRGDGISIWNTEGATVRGTLVTGARDAVYISFGKDILIDQSHLTGSRYGVHSMWGSDLIIIESLVEENLSGLVLMYGAGVDVVRNHLRNNLSPSTGFGILVKDVTDVGLVQNLVVANRTGIHLDGPAGGTEPIRVTANTVADNDYGIMLFPSVNAVVMANSFVDNLAQVGRAGRAPVDQVVWSDLGWGNYWSGYQGYDNGQGRGTVPHIEGSSVHRVLSRAPMLRLIAASPAMRVLSVMEERWMQTTPMAIDELPLLTPFSPPVPTPEPEPAAGIILGLLAAFLVAGSGGSLFSLRGRRTRIATCAGTDCVCAQVGVSSVSLHTQGSLLSGRV